MKATLDVMGERPVTIRLLDPPLHEFVPQSADERSKLAEALSIDAAEYWYWYWCQALGP